MSTPYDLCPEQLVSVLAHGCEVTEIVDHGLMRSVYFTDPNGIALEVSCWAHNPTGQAPASDDIRYSDAEPVPAVRELLETGALRALPSTRLVDAPTGDVYRLVESSQ